MKKIFVLFVLLYSLTSAQLVVSIDSLRMNDANGVPLDTGKLVRITGIVTSSNQLGTSGPGTLQDLTAGVSVYGSAFAGAVTYGDSVTVTGILTQYRGLTQIDFSRGSGSVVKHSTGHMKEPRVVTLSQIANQSWNGFEEFEGSLIRINNVTINATGNFAGNTNYNITDSSMTLTSGLRIYTSVGSIVGQPIPTKAIDIIGVLGQYKSSAPFNSGYQLIPRSIHDLVMDGEPVITGTAFASDIDTNGFTVYFKTVRKGNSQVKYGTSPELLSDSVVVSGDTTNHKVRIASLLTGQLYYFQAYSTNEYGTSVSPKQSVRTSISDTTTGTINVMFNYSVDTTVAMADNKAVGNFVFPNGLLNRINRAKYSIDMAVYSFFGLDDIANALILAKDRGVKVRLVYDYRNGAVPQDNVQMLINAGILMSRRPNANGLMHNKFFVFDGRDSVNYNDWVWTGSWNVTSAELTWKNSALEINDHSLAMAYEKEFEEMWGSTDDTPNPTNAKFGSTKTDNTPHQFVIGGRNISLYFSPSDGTEAKIRDAISTANFSAYFASYAFTSNNVQTSLKSRFNAGVTDMKGVIDQKNMTGSQWNNLIAYVDLFQNPGSTLHHKYGLIDPSYPDSDPIVIVGSHNWTNNANQDNDENTLIIHDLKIANQYMQEFKARYNEAGGTKTFVVPTSILSNEKIVSDYNLYQNYPNPFNPTTTISFSLPKSERVEVSVFNVLGQKINTLYNSVAPAGVTKIDFNAKSLTSGIYFYQLKTSSYNVIKKMLLIK